MTIHHTIKPLIDEIEAFRAKTGMSVTAFGVGAVNNGKMIPALVSGRQILPKTVDRILDFMARYGGTA